MRTVHLLAAAYPALAVLAFAPPVPVVSPVLCLVVLLVTGELAVRALVREPLGPAGRLGLATTAGLISLLVVALVLHVLGVRIEGRWLAGGLAVLVSGLGAAGWAVRPDPPHPRHWVGAEEHPGTTTSTHPSTRTALAIAVPAALAILIGGTATAVYRHLPRPAEPGYTSVALAGWAGTITHPVVFPAAGLEVPVQVSSAGEQPATIHMLVRVGGRIIGPGVPVTVAGGTQSLRVHVPAPANACLQAIRISLGPVSTVFYGRGPATPVIRRARRPAPIGMTAC